MSELNTPVHPESIYFLSTQKYICFLKILYVAFFSRSYFLLVFKTITFQFISFAFYYPIIKMIEWNPIKLMTIAFVSFQPSRLNCFSAKFQVNRNWMISTRLCIKQEKFFFLFTRHNNLIIWSQICFSDKKITLMYLNKIV